jgi:hypothetical protein
LSDGRSCLGQLFVSVVQKRKLVEFEGGLAVHWSNREGNPSADLRIA